MFNLFTTAAWATIFLGLLLGCGAPAQQAADAATKAADNTQPELQRPKISPTPSASPEPGQTKEEEKQSISISTSVTTNVNFYTPRPTPTPENVQGNFLYDGTLSSWQAKKDRAPSLGSHVITEEEFRSLFAAGAFDHLEAPLPAVWTSTEAYNGLAYYGDTMSGELTLEDKSMELPTVYVGDEETTTMVVAP